MEIVLLTGMLVTLVILALVLAKVGKEKYTDDPPRSCGLPKYDHTPYGPGSLPYACDTSYPRDGNQSGCCINQDKGLTCQAYQAKDPNKFVSICTANVPCTNDTDCFSKVYNKCAMTGPLTGTCQALDDKGNFMCGNSPNCTAYDGSQGVCINGGCQPTIKCTNAQGKNGILECGICRPAP